MKKGLRVASICLATLVGFTGCGGTAPEEKASEEVQATGNAEISEGIVKKLVIYSPQADKDRGGWFLERCMEDTGIEIQFLSSGGGELEERLVAEKGNPQADVVFGLTQMPMQQLKDKDVLIPYVPSWAEGLENSYKDADGYFHCFWQTPIVLAFNTDYISEEGAPKDWLELDKPEYKEMFAIGSIKSQTTRAILAGILWNYYDEVSGDITQEGWDKLASIYANTQTLPSGSDAWQMVKEGNTPIVLNWFGGVEANTKKNEIPIHYVVPENGTPVVAEAIGIVKGSKNIEVAKEFVEWFGSPEIMGEYANEFGQAPVHPEAIALCSEEVKAEATMFKVQNIDWEVASGKMNDWLTKIELEIMP